MQKKGVLGMKEFDVSINETLEKIVTIKAETQEEAEELIHDQWSQGIHVLNADNFIGESITTKTSREIEYINKLTALFIEPMKVPKVVKIDSDLESLQQAVGGNIETAHFFDDLIEIICNEEGKIHRLPLNRAIYDEQGEMIEIIAGSFLIVGDGEEDFESLSQEMINKYSKIFEKPEKFHRLAGMIIAQKIELPKDEILKTTNLER